MRAAVVTESGSPPVLEEREARHAASGRIVLEFETLPLAAVADAWRRQAGGEGKKLVLVS